MSKIKSGSEETNSEQSKFVDTSIIKAKVYCDVEIDDFEVCDNYTRKFVKIMGPLKLNYSYIKEIYLSDGYKPFNPNGSIYVDMEDGEEQIKEFVLKQLRHVEVFVLRYSKPRRAIKAKSKRY